MGMASTISSSSLVSIFKHISIRISRVHALSLAQSQTNSSASVNVETHDSNQSVVEIHER